MWAFQILYQQLWSLKNISNQSLKYIYVNPVLYSSEWHISSPQLTALDEQQLRSSTLHQAGVDTVQVSEGGNGPWGWVGVSAGQRPVEGIRPLYHCWVVPPSKRCALHPQGVLSVVVRLLQSLYPKAQWVDIFLMGFVPQSFIHNSQHRSSCAAMYNKLEICILNKYVKQ